MHYIPPFSTRYFSCVILLALPGCYRPAAPRPVKELPEQGGEQTEQQKTYKPTRQVKEMTTEEARSAAAYYEEVGKQDLLIATYNRIITLEKDPEVVAQHIVKLADVYFGDGNFTEAIKQYRRAITLYPGASTLERARYREIVAHFWSALQSARDQTTTEATIKLGRRYLTDFPHEASAEQVAVMIAASYRKLLAHECMVMAFYQTKYATTGIVSSLRAVTQRLSYVVNTLLPEMEDSLPEIAQVRSVLTVPLLSDEFEDEDAAVHTALHDELAGSLAKITEFLEGAPDTLTSQTRDKF